METDDIFFKADHPNESQLDNGDFREQLMNKVVLSIDIFQLFLKVDFWEIFYTVLEFSVIIFL